MRWAGAIVHLARRAVEANLRDHLSYPMKVTANVTDRCNSRCLTCNIWQWKAKDELTAAEWDAVFAKAPGISWLDLIGGEIFTRKDFFEIADAALTRCKNLFLFHFVTNALCANTAEVTERLLEKHAPPLTLLTVSLDGYPELNDKIRGIPGNWRKSVDLFKRLRRRTSSRFRVFLGMTLSSYNVREFSGTYASVKREVPDLEPSEFHLNIAQTGAPYGNEGDTIAPDPVEVRAALEEYRRIVGHKPWSPIRHLEAEYQRLGREFARTRRCPLPCRSFDVSAYIAPKGIVHPCYMWERPVGSLRENDYDLGRIWESAEASEVRRRIAAEDCPHCWTPCEAYQTIVANTLRRPSDAPSSAAA